MRFRKIITITILVVLVLHIFVAIKLTFIPGGSTAAQPRISRWYKYFVHLGPFYREESIQSSPHFIVTVNGRSTDLIQQYSNEYRDQPWKISKLTLRDYVRRSADAFYKSKNRGGSSAFLKLCKVSKETGVQISEDDSVSWVYMHRWYLPGTKTLKPDTLFQYRFKWREDELPR